MGSLLWFRILISWLMLSRSLRNLWKETNKQIKSYWMYSMTNQFHLSRKTISNHEANFSISIQCHIVHDIWAKNFGKISTSALKLSRKNLAVIDLLFLSLTGKCVILKLEFPFSQALLSFLTQKFSHKHKYIIYVYKFS